MVVRGEDELVHSMVLKREPLVFFRTARHTPSMLSTVAMSVVAAFIVTFWTTIWAGNSVLECVAV